MSSQSKSVASLLLYSLAILVYFVVLEWLLGATLGKAVTGIRVASLDGSPISLGQSLGRNLLRIVDGLPYVVPNLLGPATLAGNDRKQRIADRVAGTIVTRE